MSMIKGCDLAGCPCCDRAERLVTAAETNADPAGMARENVELRDLVEQLTAKIAELTTDGPGGKP